MSLLLKKNYFFYALLAIASVGMTLSLSGIVPHEPTLVQNYFASLWNGYTTDCTLESSHNISEVCSKASSTAASFTAYFKVGSSLLGVFLNPLIGYASDHIGRKYALMFILFFPLLGQIGLLLYIKDVPITIYGFCAMAASIIMFDANVIINSIIVDISEPSSISKVIGLMAVVSFAISTVGPFISLIPVDIMTYILIPALLMILLSMSLGVNGSAIVYFLQVSVGMDDTGRAILLAIMGLSIVLTVGVVFPYLRRHFRIPTIFIISCIISIPSLLLKVYATNLITVYIIAVLTDGFGMITFMATGIYVGEQCDKENQGAVQGYVSSYRIIGSGLGTLFIAICYSYFQNKGGFFKYVPFYIVAISYAISALIGVAFFCVSAKNDLPLTLPLLATEGEKPTAESKLKSSETQKEEKTIEETLVTENLIVSEIEQTFGQL
ncbi:hypothetical protein WA158_002543 [Blastocystis sp. Blastoise]